MFAEMVLVNPADMVEAVQYAAVSIDEFNNEIDIFIVSPAGTQRSVSLAELTEANITVATCPDRITPAASSNSILERKRLREALEAAEAEITALKRLNGEGASANTRQ